MSGAWPPTPSTKGRAEVIGKVRRLASAVELATKNERQAVARCTAIARQIDETTSRLIAAERASEPIRALQQELSNLEDELALERAELATVQETRKDATALLHEAEQERNRYIEDVELAGAPARFEGLVVRANAVLTGLAGLALTTGYRGLGEDAGPRLQIAFVLSLSALALGLISYLPTVLAASLDALRRGSAPSGTLSFLVSWHAWIHWMQAVVLAILFGLVVATWTFVVQDALA